MRFAEKQARRNHEKVVDRKSSEEPVRFFAERRKFLESVNCASFTIVCTGTGFVRRPVSALFRCYVLLGPGHHRWPKTNSACD